MITPTLRKPVIRFYAKMVDCTGKLKHPKYVITEQAGYYPPMDKLIGRDGNVSMQLLASRDSGSKKENAPEMRLQAKNNLNFTGIKHYFVGGMVSGFACGYPSDKETYSAKGKPNPFFEYKEDGFLFIFHQDEKAETEAERIRPSCIELLVLEGAKIGIENYRKQLVMGGFDEDLNVLRKQAQQTNAI